MPAAARVNAWGERMSRAQRSMSEANGALQTRNPGFFLFGPLESNRGPASAVHRSASLRAAPRAGHAV